MSPVRLLIIGVLLYLFFRLLKSARAGNKRNARAQRTTHKTTTSVQDTLVEDPVCHTHIPRKQAIRLRHNHKTLFFCSEKCCETFLEQGENR